MSLARLESSLTVIVSHQCSLLIEGSTLFVLHIMHAIQDLQTSLHFTTTDNVASCLAALLKHTLLGNEGLVKPGHRIMIAWIWRQERLTPDWEGMQAAAGS